MRRGARVAESGSLENCCPGNGTVGSIPTLSANFQKAVYPGHFQSSSASRIAREITIFRMTPKIMESVYTPLSIPSFPGNFTSP
jgi:hypothetical protein